MGSRCVCDGSACRQCSKVQYAYHKQQSVTAPCSVVCCGAELVSSTTVAASAALLLLCYKTLARWQTGLVEYSTYMCECMYPIMYGRGQALPTTMSARIIRHTSSRTIASHLVASHLTASHHIASARRRAAPLRIQVCAQHAFVCTWAASLHTLAPRPTYPTGVLARAGVRSHSPA